jgi:hypothetical protein
MTSTDIFNVVLATVGFTVAIVTIQFVLHAWLFWFRRNTPPLSAFKRSWWLMKSMFTAVVAALKHSKG